jgi:cellulose biosynthesis protein BcsQ
MTDQPVTPAPTSNKIYALLFSAKPNRREEMVAELSESDHGKAVLAAVNIDVDQVKNWDVARDALRGGADNEGAGGAAGRVPHLFLIVGGDVAAHLKKTRLDELTGYAIAGWRLLVMGLADSPDERRALDTLGVRWILTKGASGVDAFNQFTGARNELAERSARMRAAQTEQAPQIVIHKHSSDGLFPHQAVIAVHATKGGVGKTTIAGNLAYGLSLSGNPTVLVDLNADSAHVDRLFNRLLFKDRRYDYYDREDLFKDKGLTRLAAQIDHNAAAQRIPTGALLDAVVRIINEPDQHLDLLPGIYDQSDYEGGSASPAAALLSKKEWVNELISQLRAADGGWDYVVIDTGINRYTAFARMSISAADLFVLVLDASSQSSVDAEAQYMYKFLEQVELGKVPRIKGKRLIVANMLMPRTQYAPNIDYIRKAFDFFNAEAVVPVAFDMNAKLISEHEGLPSLALKESVLSVQNSPAKLDLIALVNTIVKVYGDSGNAIKQTRNGRRGFLRR